MQTLETFYELLLKIDESWALEEAVDWSDAEQIVRECKQIPVDILACMPDVQGIISYADSVENWDCGMVGRWPTVIREEMEGFDKTYHYRENGEHWEVYSLALTGAEEWKATVETEAMAESVVSLYSQHCQRAATQENVTPVQILANEYVEELTEDGRVFHGKTKRIHIHLAILERKEYGEVIEVPLEFADEDLDYLVDIAANDVDELLYFDDPDYCGKGECRHEVLF